MIRAVRVHGAWHGAGGSTANKTAWSRSARPDSRKRTRTERDRSGVEIAIGRSAMIAAPQALPDILARLA